MSTLVDQLLKADAKKATELATSTYESKKLAKILGKTEPVKIKIREIPAKHLNEIITGQIDGKGKVDYTRTFETKALVCVDGIVEPSMRDKDLQQHFNAASPKDLVEKLFGFEIIEISDAISALSISTDEDTEEKIKN